MTKKIFLQFIFASMFFASCAQNNNTPKEAPTAVQSTLTSQAPVPKNISSQELKEKMDQKEPLIIIDVRTPAEIADGKIAGAMEINFSDPTFKDKINALAKDKNYVVYCKVGGRSTKAQQMMLDAGIVNVSNLTGGFDGWKSNNK